MTIQTNLHGRLRNTPLLVSHALAPLYEAVVNSIHAIEDIGSLHGEITIDILRLPQSSLDLDQRKTSESDVNEIIVGFKVTDNGIGFNDLNMQSFQTLDSEHKAEKGCRGVGRLLWLKAFDKVHVSSVFKSSKGLLLRKFSFDSNSGVSEPVDSATNEESLVTCVHLAGFKKNYQEASSKTIDTIANNLLEHCLWYFVRDGGAPSIIIRDNHQVVKLDGLYEEYMYSSATCETIDIKGQKFLLTHLKFSSSSSKHHSISYCAANRLVKEENISGKIAGLSGKIHGENGEFIYSCYISSPYLDKRVRSERTSFDLAEDVDDLLSKTEISFKNIRDEVIIKAKDLLNPYLSESIKAGRERVDSFVAEKAPRYRPILSRIPDEDLIVDPTISDKDLELVLHKHLSDIERRLLDEGHTIMSPKTGENASEYRSRLNEYIRTITDIKKSDLASYVSHRRTILDLLESAIQRNEDGSYSREDMIHELIMPMRIDSNEAELESSNLWLLDERLAFHDYLASDKSLNSMPITGSSDKKEPDLCALKIMDTPILVSGGKTLPLASIVVIEIKRPMRNDAKAGRKSDPIEQALDYLNRIRTGGVTTSSGRPIPESDDIPGFCYVICDITDSVKKRCEMFDLTITSDHMGYFGFHKSYKSYIEVVSFDRLVNSAKERNKAFFDQLGLPTK